MTPQEYEAKKRECWEKFRRENLDGEVQWQPVSRYDVFCAAFDRAYALGKQDKDAEGEEMLTVSSNSVRVYKENIDRYRPKAVSAYDKGFWIGQDAALQDLFGSKCLPDGTKNDTKEPKPPEPKPIQKSLFDL